MPPRAVTPPTDAAADAAVAAVLVGREPERLGLLAASAVAFARFKTATDPGRKQAYSDDIARLDADLAEIEAVITDLGKIAGKNNSGQRLAKSHDDAVAECAVWVAANVVTPGG